MSTLDRIKRGFSINGKHPIETEDWIYDENASTESKIVFYGYDANFYPLPMISTWPSKEQVKKVITRALELTEGVEVEVWVDDIQIRDSKGDVI